MRNGISSFKKNALSALMCLVVFMLVIPTAVFAYTDRAISFEAEEHILSQLRGVRIPNASIGVIQGGETSYIFKDSTHDTLFQIGSVSKSFTGFGVLYLEYEGLLSVSDPVNKHLPWVEVYYNGVPVPHEDMTIGNLLHHTSGFTSDERHFTPYLTGGLTANAFIAQITGVELAFYPSTQFVYGNVNYVILGLLIETVSGLSYDEFMTQNILHPLGLYNTFTNPMRAYETGAVIGGNSLGFLRTRSQNFNITPLVIPAGFIYSNITDMVRWAQIHLGMIDVSEHFMRVIQRSHELSPISGNPYAGLDFHYAAGWVVHSGYGFIEHNGGAPGYSATLRMYHDRNTAVVFLSNLNYSPIARVSDFIFDTTEGGVFHELPTDFFGYLDVIFTIITVIGIAYALLFARLVIKLMKRMRSGERIWGKTNPKVIARLIGLVISLAVLIGSYLVPPAIFGNSRVYLVLFEPASSVTATTALWVIAAYYFCSFLIQLFASPRPARAE